MTNAQLIFLCLVILVATEPASSNPKRARIFRGVLAVIGLGVWISLCLWEKPDPIPFYVNAPTYEVTR